MADLSSFSTGHPRSFSIAEADVYRAAMRGNITTESAVSLRDRLLDAEQMWRYFCRRDEMNAEVHLVDAPAANVRYSPITIAAERVVGYLARLFYGREVEYRTATGQASLLHPADAPEEYVAAQNSVLLVLEEWASRHAALESGRGNLDDIRGFVEWARGGGLE